MFESSMIDSSAFTFNSNKSNKMKKSLIHIDSENAYMDQLLKKHHIEGGAMYGDNRTWKCC